MTPNDKCANCKVGIWVHDVRKKRVTIYYCSHCSFKYVFLHPVKRTLALPFKY